VSTMVPTVAAFPVSVKGVLVRDGQVLLLKNERDEWELPGGKLEPGEQPVDCVAREVTEETGLQVTTGPILDSWQYHITAGRNVLVVTYGCYPENGQPPALSSEHKGISFFAPSEIGALLMPTGYKCSIQSWLTYLASTG